MVYTVISGDHRNCISCGQSKAIGEFYEYRYKTKQGNASTRLDSRCKPCARVRRRGDYHANASERKATAREYKRRKGTELLDKVRVYRAENRDKWLRQKRAYEQKRRAGASLDSSEAVALIERVLEEARFGLLYLDAYTGDLITDPEVDHIVPLSRGGKHEYENLCVTSGFNNRSKRDRPALVWLLERRRECRSGRLVSPGTTAPI